MKLKTLPPEYQTLVKRAIQAKKLSYSPYSKFRVGAALLTKNGKIIPGSNVENSSYGLTVCAERIALFTAKMERLHSFKAIAIATDVEDLVPPCGACRQVIVELAGDIDIIMTNSKGEVNIMKAYSLLPNAFNSNMLRKK